MKKFLFATAAVAAFVAAAPASAATFLFSFTGANLVGSGTFTTTDTVNAAGARTITGTTGTLTAGTTTLTFTGPVAYAGSDNLLFAANPYLNINGTSAVTSSGFNINLYYVAATPTYRIVSSNSTVLPGTVLTSFTVTPVGAVPEPASWALMIGGFGLTGGMMRRRAGKVSYATA